MKKIFTFLVAFLTTVSGAVWGQSYDDDYNLSNLSNDLEISATSGTYKIQGNTTEHGIIVNGGGSVNITLSGAEVDLSSDQDGAAFRITGNTTVYLTLEGSNKMISGGNHAGIFVDPSATLVITRQSTGSIDAACVSEDEHLQGLVHANGAGIGGSEDQPNFGTIRIEGGTVSARCHTDKDYAHANGAALGGGNGSTSGTIIIVGGTVNAKCSDVRSGVAPDSEQAVGAAIGGGYAGSCTSITILGGDVTASVEAGGQKGFYDRCWT